MHTDPAQTSKVTIFWCCSRLSPLQPFALCFASHCSQRRGTKRLSKHQQLPAPMVMGGKFANRLPTSINGERADNSVIRWILGWHRAAPFRMTL